jgi:hypothetical protein
VNRPRTTVGRSVSRARSVVAALSLALLAAFALPAAAGAAPMYWGATIKGETYGTTGEAPTNRAILERFEHDAGKKISMVNIGQTWINFERPAMNAAIAADAIPVVTMPLEGTLAEVISGSEDTRIRAWAKAAKEFGYPFLFRPWWEPNGDWYSWGRSPEYVAAWRHFHDVVESVGATNVTWAWVVNAIWNDPVSLPGPWYPGPEYVDWVGMDSYNWGVNPIQPARWLTAEETIQPTLAELERIAPGKPVCICESASTEIGEPGAGRSKATWIHEMFDSYLPNHPAIKAFLWFNWNIEKESMPTMRMDWPIESSPAAELAFREAIAAPDYLSSLPVLNKLAKVPTPDGPPGPPPVVEEEEGELPEARSPVAAPPAAPALLPLAGEPVEPPVAADAPVATRVALGAPRPQPSADTAKLPLWIPGAGELNVTARGARVGIVSAGAAPGPSVSHLASGVERLMLQVNVVGLRLRQLSAQGRTTVTVRVAFTPNGGSPTVRRLQLTLRAQT